MYKFINLLVEKYQRIPPPAKASLWFFVAAFFQKAISFISTPIFTRLLSTDEYGRYNVFTSWMGIISVIVSLNLASGVYTRGLVKYDKDRKVFSSSLQGLTLLLVLCWTVIYFVLSDYINSLFSLTTFQMLMMILMIWTTTVFSFWSMEQRVEYKYKRLIVITILVSILKPMLGIILVSNSNDKVTARIIGLAIVELVFYPWFFISQVKNGKTLISKKYWTHALSFNIPLIPHYLSTIILNSSDRIMISRMVGDSSAGIYSLAYSISMIMTIFNTALMQTVEPWIYRKIKNKDIQNIKNLAYPLFGLIGVVNLILIILAPEVLRIFAPVDYREAIYVIPPIALSVFFMFLFSFFAAFEFYFSKTKMIAIATCAGAILNIMLNTFCIKRFGYLAAGYTTLICYMLYAFCHYFFMRKICRKYLENKQPYSPKFLILISICIISLGIIFMITYDYSVIRYSIFGCSLVIAFYFRKQITGIIITLLKS